MPKYNATVRRILMQELSELGQIEVEADNEEDARRMVEKIARSEAHPEYLSLGEGTPGETKVRSVDIQIIEAIDGDA